MERALSHPLHKKRLSTTTYIQTPRLFHIQTSNFIRSKKHADQLVWCACQHTEKSSLKLVSNILCIERDIITSSKEAKSTSSQHILNKWIVRVMEVALYTLTDQALVPQHSVLALLHPVITRILAGTSGRLSQTPQRWHSQRDTLS